MAGRLFGHHGHDPDREPVRLWHVGRDEVDARLLQAEEEVSVARQPVELGDEQFRSVHGTGG